MLKITLAMLVTFLISGCADISARYRQDSLTPPAISKIEQRAVVVLAFDAREQTNLRNLDHMGQFFFRKIEDDYEQRAKNDFDFGYQYSVSADWGSMTGVDENRVPKVFFLDPGLYVVERIIIGQSASTFYPGFSRKSGRATYGYFAVKPGEVINLGRLVVQMYWNRGTLSAFVRDDIEEAKAALSKYNLHLEDKIVVRPITMVESFPFKLD